MSNQTKVLTTSQISEGNKLTKGLDTKSSKIRKLYSEGWEKGDISRYLNIRYQHVRNVLVQPYKGN